MMFWRKKRPKSLYLNDGSEELRMSVDDGGVQLTVSNRNWAEACYWTFTDEQFNELAQWIRVEEDRRWHAEQEGDYVVDHDAKTYSNDDQIAELLVGKKIRTQAVEGPHKYYTILWEEVQDITIDEQGHMAVQLVEDEPESNWHYVPFTTPIYVRN